MANCYACKAEIVFDNEHIGKNGRKIPLDPATHQPHDCPMREKPQRDENGIYERRSLRMEEDHDSNKDIFGVKNIAEKNDHGNEQTWSNETLKIRNPDNTGTDDLIPKYVDHTVARPSKVKIFHAENSDLVELAYNEFLKSKTFQWTRAQLGAKGNEFAIALYYEETKE